MVVHYQITVKYTVILKRYMLADAVESRNVTSFPHTEGNYTTWQPSAMKETERPVGSSINHSQMRGVKHT